jgi:hypothetical protein
LWEVRTSLASNRIAGVIFCFHALALSRKEELER